MKNKESFDFIIIKENHSTYTILVQFDGLDDTIHTIKKADLKNATIKP